MADLDDFFAKKDKKKKSKKGFSKANTDVLAKNLEENDRREQQAEEKANNDASRQMRIIHENQTGLHNDNEADEWKEYEDRRTDYTNLKIDTLKIDADSDQNEEGDEVNEVGEKVKRSKEGGPWSKLVASDSLDRPEGEDKAPEPAKDEKPEPAAAPAAANKSSYVPPHLRNAASSSASANASAAPGGPRGPRRPKHAPDINSEVYFPSLSAAMGTDDPNRGQGQNSHGFEEVKSGGSGQSYSSRNADGPNLSLGNKFAALRD